MKASYIGRLMLRAMGWGESAEPCLAH